MSTIKNKLRKASNGTRAVPTSLSTAKAAGAATASINVNTGWPSDTDVDVVMYLVDTSGNKVAGSQTDWVANISGTTLSNMDLRAGTEPATGYPGTTSTVVTVRPTAAWNDDLIDALLGVLNQDGSFKTAPIQTALGLGAGSLNGWNALGYTPNTVTANGNRSYTLTFNGQNLTGTLSAGMRLRTTRTVAAPTQCTSLNGTTQYYSKTAPAGMSFTTTFTLMTHQKLASYPAAAGILISRTNNPGVNGFRLYIDSNGRIVVDGSLSAGNYRQITSYQSVPLNKWAHIAATVDMSSGAMAIYLDGIAIPVQATGTGTATTLVQAGNLEIGSQNGGAQTFSGKIAQAAVFSAALSQATIQNYMNQGLLGTETFFISAYSFNASTSDLNTTNANNLTSNGSAVATNADSPFGGQAGGTISGTLDYAEVVDATFSTNTTIIVRTPHTNTIPTSGGVSAVVYSSQQYPYGWPVKGKLSLGEVMWAANQQNSATAIGTQVTGGTITATCPTGGQKLIIRVSSSTFGPGAGVGVMGVFDGSTQIGQYNSSGNNGMSLLIPYYATGGSHTFSLQMYETSAGTVTFGGATTAPATFTVYESE